MVRASPFVIVRALTPAPAIELDVNYIAEHHENLNHILVFLTITGAMPGVDVSVEVLPRLSNSSGGSRLVVKAGSQRSQPLVLPREVVTGKAEVRSQNGHFEVKLATSTSSSATSAQHTPLLDATQLGDIHPTSFICSSCSLPIVQSSRISQYRDLPSEHWQELVDAWMCHADQKLHDDVKKNSKGFWPKPGEALVGGSYILFEESVITKSNLHPSAVKKVSPISSLCLFHFRAIKKAGVGIIHQRLLDGLGLPIPRIANEAHRGFGTWAGMGPWSEVILLVDTKRPISTFSSNNSPDLRSTTGELHSRIHIYYFYFYLIPLSLGTPMLINPLARRRLASRHMYLWCDCREAAGWTNCRCIPCISAPQVRPPTRQPFERVRSTLRYSSLETDSSRAL